MKKSTLLFMVLITSSLFVFEGCKSKKKAKAEPPKGEVQVKLYCSGADYFTTKDYFRANSLGESTDQVAAKKKAMSNAKAELASMVNTTIKGVIDNYLNSREFNNKEELEERFESLTREVINQEISGIKVICEEHTKTQENTYKTYLAIELSADKLASSIKERLANDERLKIDYDYEKFKKTFDEEMKKLEQGY
ncbi:MAG TPA: hypothetical protein VIK89_15765 [Cytophagaceae bacterium]